MGQFAVVILRISSKSSKVKKSLKLTNPGYKSANTQEKHLSIFVFAFESDPKIFKEILQKNAENVTYLVLGFDLQSQLVHGSDEELEDKTET